VTGMVLLIDVGAMLVLIGVVFAVAAALGVRGGAGSRGRRQSRLTRRVEVTPLRVAAGVVGVLTLLVTGWIAAGIGAAGAVLLVPSIWASTAAAEEIALLEGVSGWTRRLADLLASGAASSLETALRKSATVAPDVIADRVSLLVSRMGPQGVRAALLGFARDIADPVADEVVMALILQLRHGGRGLAQVLTGLAVTVDDRIRMRRDVESDRAKYRSNARTIVVLFVVMSAGMLLFSRAFLTPYGTPLGQLALAGVVAVFAVALLWLRRMIRQTPGVRLLVATDFQPDLSQPRDSLARLAGRP
jgi:tight adherence protein B